MGTLQYTAIYNILLPPNVSVHDGHSALSLQRDFVKCYSPNEPAFKWTLTISSSILPTHCTYRYTPVPRKEPPPHESAVKHCIPSINQIRSSGDMMS